MNFNNVKSITIPEGDVLKIEDSLNRILWQKNSGPIVNNLFYMENLDNADAEFFVWQGTSSHTVTLYKSTDGITWSTLASTNQSFVLPGKTKYYLKLSDYICPRMTTSTVPEGNSISGAGDLSKARRVKLGGKLIHIYIDQILAAMPQYPSQSGGHSSMSQNNVLFRKMFWSNEHIYDISDLDIKLDLAPYNMNGTDQYLMNRQFQAAFYACPNLTILPERIPAAPMFIDASGSTYCNLYTPVGYYENMFGHCTSITRTPWINTKFETGDTYTLTQLQAVAGNMTYQKMFDNCSNLSEIRIGNPFTNNANFTIKIAGKTLTARQIRQGSNVIENMFRNVSANGTITMPSGLYNDTTLNKWNNLPSGWTYNIIQTI